ncbi:hypothetical protein FACS1894158_02130 [Betaproteobacteria bacterium]|nr:hypothetical protein FACS1894158_02130 [Betaproteobacteria bacterium]
MNDNIENLLLEHMKKIQAELGAARERDVEIMSRLSGIEEGIARIGRNEASNYTDIIHDRHSIDRLNVRIERIERRLELAN